MPAASLLIAPPAVTAAVLLAAALHEGGHLLALRAFRVPLDGLRLGVFGAVICARGASRLSYGRELIVTLAGPAVNLLCAPAAAALSRRFAWEWGYLFAGAHILLGAYNLLPAAPLDGCRALYLITAYFFGPDAGERACRAAGALVSLALCALGAYLTRRSGGFLFLLAALGLALQQMGIAKKRVSV